VAADDHVAERGDVQFMPQPTLGYARRDWPYLVPRYLDGRIYRLPGNGPNGPALVLRSDVDALIDRKPQQ